MEEVGLVKQSQPKLYTAYQKSEYYYMPKDKAWSWFGGSGLTYKFTDDFSIDGYFAGKTTSCHNDGYLADLTFNYSWAKLDTDIADLTFGSQARLRYHNCGCETEQLRLTPLKFTAKNKCAYIPIDEVYAYPIYATLVHDFKDGENTTKYGSIIGITKNIDKNSSIYLELEADTKGSNFGDRCWGATIGYKHTF